MSQGKGSSYRKGHSPAKQREGYDEIDWSKGKESQTVTSKKGKEASKCQS